jgi:hypothetical protein
MQQPIVVAKLAYNPTLALCSSEQKQELELSKWVCDQVS